MVQASSLIQQSHPAFQRSQQSDSFSPVRLKATGTNIILPSRRRPLRKVSMLPRAQCFWMQGGAVQGLPLVATCLVPERQLKGYRTAGRRARVACRPVVMPHHY